jgi:hypothetical protein
MTALRFISGLLLLIAVTAMVSDVTHAQLGDARGAFGSPLGLWTELAPATLASAQKTVQRAVHPWLWDPVLRSLLALPTWLSFGALGLLCAWGGRRRKRVNVFTN